jgi:hypothetical protein
MESRNVDWLIFFGRRGGFTRRAEEGMQRYGGGFLDRRDMKYRRRNNGFCPAD